MGDAAAEAAAADPAMFERSPIHQTTTTTTSPSPINDPNFFSPRKRKRPAWRVGPLPGIRDGILLVAMIPCLLFLLGYGTPIHHTTPDDTSITSASRPVGTAVPVAAILCGAFIGVSSAPDPAAMPEARAFAPATSSGDTIDYKRRKTVCQWLTSRTQSPQVGRRRRGRLRR